MRPLLLACALFVSGLACSTPPPRPAPAVAKVAPDLARLRVHVHQLVTPAETPEDEEEYKRMPGLTRELRSAFEVMLARAGYTVVLGRRDPKDVIARIVAQWDNARAGVATLTLTADGQVIAQVSAVVPRDTSRPYGDWYFEEGAAALLEAMTRSPAVQALARANAKRGVLQVPEASK